MKRSKDEIRNLNWKHAMRKRRISQEIYKWDRYENLHQYSKNKIHCSCPDCRGKWYSVGENSRKNLKICEQARLREMDEQEDDIEDYVGVG